MEGKKKEGHGALPERRNAEVVKERWREREREKEETVVVKRRCV